MKEKAEFNPGSVEAAKQKALALLDKRDYSRTELLRRLTEKGYEDAAAVSAVDRLVELGFVDDARYAPIVVRHYAAKGYGSRRIRDELYRRKVPRALWDEALEQQIRDNAYKLMSPQALKAAQAAGRAVDVSADDFEG